MRRIEDILLATGKVPVMGINSVRAKIGDNDNDLLEHFMSAGIVTESDVYKGLAKISGLGYISLRGREIPADVLSLLPSSFCRAEKIIPIQLDGENLFIATPNPDNFRAIDEISASSLYSVITVVTSPSELQEALDLYFRSDDEIGKLSEEIEQVTGEAEEEVDDLGDTDTESPVVRFVNLLIAQAIQDRASDIHVEPGERELIVRYRIDGVMHKMQKADKGIQNGVVSRLKIMSDIDIGERRKPQDGRMSVRHNGKPIDIRVVTLPTSWGEKVVMRILDHSNERRSISSIGMSETNERIFKKHISKPHGMILVTGPTGSGKALPLDTKIPTPAGFTTMGEIVPGDQIFGGNGKVYSVTSTSEIINDAEMYEIVFSDGQKVIADADHQWLVSTDSGRSSKSRTKNQAVEEYVDSHKTLTKLAYLSLEFTPEFGFRTADEILSLVQKEGIDYYSSPLSITQSLHMVDVYGQQGERKTDSSNVIVMEYPIEEALMGLARRIRQQHTVVQYSNTPVFRATTREMLENGLFAGNNTTGNYAIPVNKAVELPEKELTIDPYIFGTQLKDASRIPLDYLRSSVVQRLDLLQGIVDRRKNSFTEKDIEVVFDESESALIEDTLQLIRSLGIKVCVNGRKIVFNSDFKKVDSSNQWNYVVDIKPLDSAPAKCISVNSPDFTYLIGEGFITTSNSTTIYTALDEVSNETVNVVTVEDPVEKKIQGISQMQINNKAGMTFSNALRSILRADPDIVFLGEIRDEETAKIAVDASMTGHLVLSTLHTNGAPEAAARLSEMGVEPYLVASSVTCVVAQRLARRLCNDCKVPMESDPEVLRKTGFPYVDAQLYKPVGCSLCANTGYKGRVALTEVLEIDERIEAEIIGQKTATEIRKKAEKDTDFVSLKVDGWEKVAKGITTIEEILRVAA